MSTHVPGDETAVPAGPALAHDVVFAAAARRGSRPRRDRGGRTLEDSQWSASSEQPVAATGCSAGARAACVISTAIWTSSSAPGRLSRGLLLERMESIGLVCASAPVVGIVRYGLPEAPERSRETPIPRYFLQIMSRTRSSSGGQDLELVRPTSRPSELSPRWLGPVPRSSLSPPPDGRPIQHRRVEPRLKDAEVSGEYGLLGKNALFADDWIPYAENRHRLRDADLGLTLHADTTEAEFAARAR